MSMCRVVSCVVGRGCCYDLCVLLAKVLAFALLHFVLQDQTCLLFQAPFDFLLLLSSPLSKGQLEPTTKDILYPKIYKRKKPHNKVLGGGYLWYNPIPHPASRGPRNWRTIILQKLPHRSESSEPHVRLPILGSWHWEDEPPKHLALKASRVCLQELHRTGGNKDSTREGHFQVP